MTVFPFSIPFRILLAVGTAGLLLGGCDRRDEPPKPAVSAPATPSSSIESPTTGAPAPAASTASTDTPPPASTLSSDSAPSNGSPPSADTGTGARIAGAAKSGGETIASKAADATGKVSNVIDDSVVTGKVKAALLADDTVKGLDVNVETRQNVVTLSGTVASQAQIESATRIAQNTDGVKQVNNNLKVRQ